MAKLISYLIFFIISINFCFSQNFEKYSVDKDLSSYYYFSTKVIQNEIFSLQNKDFTSFYYYNIKYQYNNFNEIWDGNKIYIDKFGGFNHKFSENITVEENDIYTKENPIFPQWIIYIFLISLVILAWTNFFYSKYLIELFRAFFNYRASVKLFNESNILTGRSAFAIIINFFIIISLNIFLIINYFKIEIFKNLILLIIILFGSIVISFLKNILVVFAGKLLNNIKVARLYNFNIRLYNQVLAILLTPITIIFTYIYLEFKMLILCIILVIIIIVYLARLIRCFKIFFQEHFSIFYLFLYLCIIEFLPIYIIIKVYNNILY